MIIAGCIDTGNTGIDLSALAEMAAFGGIIALGIVMRVARRTEGWIRPFGAALLVSLLLSIGLVAEQGISATTTECGKSGVPATIMQTSTLSGLAPEVASLRIAGVITNPGTRALRIDSIVVSISRVVKAPGAVAGDCSAGDYLLTANRMRIRATLAPGASAIFGGARIGFANSTRNQDACKSATVSLRYDAFGKRRPGSPNSCGRDSAWYPKRWISQLEPPESPPCKIEDRVSPDAKK